MDCTCSFAAQYPWLRLAGCGRSAAFDLEVLALNQAIIGQAALRVGADIRSNPNATQHLRL